MRELRRSSLQSKSVSLLWPKSCCVCLCRRLIRCMNGGSQSGASASEDKARESGRVQG